MDVKVFGYHDVFSMILWTTGKPNVCGRETQGLSPKAVLWVQDQKLNLWLGYYNEQLCNMGQLAQ